MKNVGVISVTLNAVIPMMVVLRAERSLAVKNYLDEGLQALVQKEGKITDNSFARMTTLLNNAICDGADAILLTCTVFTPYLERLQSLFSVPLVSADGAMLEQAARMNKKTAILCTFPATTESSAAVFNAASNRLGLNSKADVYLLEDAAQAIETGDAQRHDQLIADKAVQLGCEYKIIVLAQISMSTAANLLQNVSFTVLTSPKSSIQTLLSL
jgi:aspartate/glutamate racemase